MSRISVIKSRLKRLLYTPVGDELLNIPESLLNEIAEKLRKDEELLLSIKALSASYRAPSIIDSNTFFNPYIFLTNLRILIAKNSSRLNIFREIRLQSIADHSFDTGSDKSRFTIQHPDSSDIITFPDNSAEQLKRLSESFEAALGNLLKSDTQTIFCRHCGKRIPQESRFCQICGNRL